METRKAILILVIILSGFTLAVASASIYIQSIIINGTICSCVVPIPVLIPFFASLGLLIGAASYYIFSIKTEKPKFEIVMRFLNEDEKKVVNAIIKGANTQAKINKLTGLGRVKVYRTIKKLIDKGIIQREKFGKVVRIELSEEMRKKFSF